MFNPKRPEINAEIIKEAVGSFVEENLLNLPLDREHEELIDNLFDHYQPHKNGFQLAKDLEWEDWDIDAEMVQILDNLDGYVKDQLLKAEKEWVGKHNIQPPLSVGTEVKYRYGHGEWKTGEITGICTHSPGRYLIKPEDQNDEECNHMRAVVKWEHVKEIEK